MWYYAKHFCRYYLPMPFPSSILKRKFHSLRKFDKSYINERVNYYNRLENLVALPENTATLSNLKPDDTYGRDTFEYTRFFPKNLKMVTLFGDIDYIPNVPSIVKSRPIKGENTNSIVLNLDKIRHFLFVKDPTLYENKMDKLVFRANVHQAHRFRFLEMYINHPMCNIGQTNKDRVVRFPAPRMTISEQLQYKFILCLEGNDVSSSLKWVMSSNSLAVMPEPKFETWFMEGKLIADYHYIRIKDNYSDLEERLNFYIEHPDKALEIISHAHEYIAQFKNKKREDLISLMVLKKYFEKTDQWK